MGIKIILIMIMLSQVREIFGDPFAIPLHALVPYYESKDDSAKSNPIPYDNYGTPPDFFPAIIPEIGLPPSSNYFGNENETYPGMYESNKCDSVKNCPVEVSDSHYPDPNAPYFPVNFPGDERSWQCNLEVDCFAQEYIPDDLSNETEILFLRSFSFTELKVGNLSVLPPLIKLRIEYSDLATIEPGAFSSQSTLEILELEGNDLHNLQPSTFSELKDLTSLDLSNNQIKKISRETFRGLDALELIRLATNLLTEIPAFAFAEMSNLAEITLDDNNITFLANDSFSALPKLEKISLTDNMLRSVPNIALREPPALKNLHLSGNPIRKIYRYDFKGMERLEVLWLDHCNLESIEKRAFHNKMFKTLVLSFNYLTSFPNLGTMRKLREFVTDHNLWNCDCDMVAVKKWLKRHSKIQSQDPICYTPDYYHGRRVLEISNDDLCSKPPVRPTSNEPRPVYTKPTWGDRIYEDETSEEEDGWADQIYDISKLYTVIDTVSPVQSTDASQSTVNMPVTEAITEYRTSQSPNTTNESVTQNITDAYTTRDFARENLTTDDKTTTEANISHTSAEQPTETKKTIIKNTEYPMNKPNAEISVLAIVLPLVAGIILFIIVILIIGCRKLARKRQSNSEEDDEQCVEYKASNGTHNGNAVDVKSNTPTSKESRPTEDDTEVPVGT